MEGQAELLPIAIDGTDYQFRTVADRNGLQVVVAEVSELPKASLVRRIDAQLRKQLRTISPSMCFATSPDIING